eukprot:1736122-Pleurochrysis_carterae.AAC.1
MAAISDLGEANQLAAAQPGSHLRVFKVSPVSLEHRSLSTEERQFLNSIEHVAPYAAGLPALTHNKNVNKAFRS